MTFEHIPPQSCFNSSPVRAVSNADLLISVARDKREHWDTNGLKYDNLQSGFGVWSLCADCNSKTGKWYGSEYAKFSRTIHSLLINEETKDDDFLDFEMFDVYPLRIIKQILSMVCSINQDFQDDTRIKTLASFVLNKEAADLSIVDYRIYLFGVRKSVQRFWPMTLLLNGLNEACPIIDVVSEIFTYPIGVAICFNPRDDFHHCGLDITRLCNVAYDQSCDIHLRIPVLESYCSLPLNYMGKEELLAAENNSAYKNETD